MKNKYIFKMNEKEKGLTKPENFIQTSLCSKHLYCEAVDYS